MKTSTLPAVAFFLAFLPLAAPIPAQNVQAPPGPAAQSPAQAPSAHSRVRIVRLSEVKGAVQVDRAIGRGFEPAMANLPIVENSKVETAMGVAEIEFEDNSTLRLGPDTAVEFPLLERDSAGSTLSTVHVVKGSVYVNLMKSRPGQFTLLFGNRSLPLPPAAHIRLQMDQQQAQLASLGGPLRLGDSSSALDVPRKKTLTFNLAQQTTPAISKGVASQGLLDDWDKRNTGYHARAAAFSGVSTPYSYGLNDMAYYGSFVDAAGCGMMWRPYFASAAWDPYSNGAWAYYSTGYSWVSPYPWGWMPYHYGSWSMCPGMGWGWQPGGYWNGLNNGTATALRYSGGGSGAGPTGPPLRPIHPPHLGQPTIVPVNSKPLVHSGIASASSFQFRRDSAGLGIPRETLGNLHRFSQRADSRGVSSTHIYISAPATMSGPARAGANRGYVAGPAMHSGYAPPLSNSMQPGFAGRGGGGFSPTSSGPAMSAPSAGARVSAPSGGSHR
ncbi:MAG: FecR domain-containing protein [Acidobacteriota bacterium]|nr:FecR domain-containing protein [Acidobacteriota bacterium]